MAVCRAQAAPALRPDLGVVNEPVRADAAARLLTVQASKATADGMDAVRLETDMQSTPLDAVAIEDTVDRAVWPAMLRGWRQTCPCCGEGKLYKSYLKVSDACGVCGTELHHHRADDAPPYFVMTITAHVVIGGIFFIEKNFTVDPWLQLAIWTPILLLMSLWLLPRVKGLLVAYQWALRMHGFGGVADMPESDPLPERVDANARA